MTTSCSPRHSLRSSPSAATRCSPAIDPEAAIALADRDDVDAWLIDLHFPGRSPAEVLRRIRSASPAVPIVVLTADCDRSSLQAALANGADGVALKTDGIDEVERLLCRVRASPFRGGSSTRSRPGRRSKEPQRARPARATSHSSPPGNVTSSRGSTAARAQRPSPPAWAWGLDSADPSPAPLPQVRGALEARARCLRRSKRSRQQCAACATQRRRSPHVSAGRRPSRRRVNNLT